MLAGEAARLVMDAVTSGGLIGLLSTADPALDEEGACAIKREIHERRMSGGERPVGRKIGWTNRTIWPQFNVTAPIWAYILDCIDRITHGFGVVQCPFPERRFQTVETTAACGLHGALVSGPRVAVADVEDCAQKLRAFTVTVVKNGADEITGGGANVLDSPLLALAHLQSVLASQAHATPLQAGEVVTTGTLTVPLPATAGDRISVALDGIKLPTLTLAIE